MQLQWPTKLLDKKVRSKEFDTKKRVKIQLANVRDVTHEAQQQLINYAPDITQIGPQLKSERHGRKSLYGGMLVRALEKKKPPGMERCLQYIYIWTEQKSAISWLWMLIAPLFMGSWGLAIWGFFGFPDWEYANIVARFQEAIADDFWGAILTPTDLWLPGFVAGFSCCPFLIAAALLHRWDFAKGSGVSFRSVTPLIPYSLLMWLVPFSWLIPLLIMVAAIGVCMVYWVLEKRQIVKTAHAMDYLPVFIWLHFDGNWKFEKASWDRFHYLTEEIKRKELEDSGNLTVQTIDGKEEIGARVKLQMANPWHSVRPGGWPTQWWWQWVRRICVLLLMLALLRMYLIYVSGYYAIFPWGGLEFGIYCFVVSAVFIVLVTMPTKLASRKEIDELNLPQSVSDFDLCNFTNHLNQKRLRVLWNLVHVNQGYDTSPRLKVITKLQDPYNSLDLPYYYDDFRDDIEYLYMVITNLSEIFAKSVTPVIKDMLVAEKVELVEEAVREQEQFVMNQSLQMAFLPKERIDETAVKSILDSSFELALKAAEAAKDEGKEEVTKDHVKKAREYMEK